MLIKLLDLCLGGERGGHCVVSLGGTANSDVSFLRLGV